MFSTFFVGIVELIAGKEWELAGLGEWSVRELVAPTNVRSTHAGP